jgi:hypothetical protein
MGSLPTLTPEQRRGGTTRRAQGATLQGKNWRNNYNVGISTIRRATRAARPMLWQRLPIHPPEEIAEVVVRRAHVPVKIRSGDHLGGKNKIRNSAEIHK